MATRPKRKKPGVEQAVAIIKDNEELQPEPEKPIELEVVEPGPSDLVSDGTEIINGDQLLKLTSSNLKKMAAIGQQIESLGTVRLNNGGILITKEALIRFIGGTQKLIEEEKIDFLEAGRTMASVANSVARLSKEFRSQNTSVPYKKPRSKRQGMEPGTEINVTNNNIHLHQNKE